MSSSYNSDFFRKLSNLVEGRLPDYDYEEEAKEVIVRLKSYKSGVYTKLGKKFADIKKKTDELKQLEEEAKAEVKENITDLFDATDAVKTRVVETVSFVFTLSKDPVTQPSVKHAEILKELEEKLTPELLEVLDALKKKYTTPAKPKSPSIKVASIEEGIGSGIYTKLKSLVFAWCRQYDRELDRLKKMARMI